MVTSVRISNQLLSNLQRLPDEIMRKVKAEVIETALVDIETPAKQQCRVLTGRLRSSIHTKYETKNTSYTSQDNDGKTYDDTIKENPIDKKTKFTCIVGSNVEYAQKIETLDKFLQKPFIQAKPRLKRRIKEIIKGL